MNTLENNLIIYDGNCKTCLFFRNFLVKFTGIGKEKFRALNELSDAERKRIDTGEFKNGIALIAKQGGETSYGAPAIAQIFSSKPGIFSVLLKFRIFYLAFEFIYKLIATNRYIIATPKDKYQCDCNPDVNVVFNSIYIIITFFVSFLIILFSFHKLMGIFPGNLKFGDWFPAAFFTANSIQILLMFLLFKRKALKYAGHAATILFMGSILLLPFSILIVIFKLQNAFIPVLMFSVIAVWMIYLHYNRVKYLEISQWWTFSWFLLHAGVIWFFIHH